MTGRAHAQEAPELILRDRPARTYLLLGPLVSALHRDQAWDSQVGGQVQVHRQRKERLLASLGLSAGVASFARYRAFRLNLDAYAGTEIIENLPFGLALGPVVDLFHTHEARTGAQGTLWIYAGLAPYLRVTAMYGLGAPAGMEFELGLRIPFSLRHW